MSKQKSQSKADSFEWKANAIDTIVSKRDRQAIARLFAKYSISAVAHLAKSVRQEKRSRVGRPANLPHNMAMVWAHIEYLRKTSASGRITDACAAISKRMAKLTPPPHPAPNTLRRMHWQANKLRGVDESLTRAMDETLAYLEKKRPRAGQSVPKFFPFLWKKTDPVFEGIDHSPIREYPPLTLDLTSA